MEPVKLGWQLPAANVHDSLHKKKKFSIKGFFIFCAVSDAKYLR